MRKRARSRSSDVTVNLATNSVTVRAIFPNPRGELLPGMFVRARLEEGSSPDAILVPQSAVTRNSKGEPTALIVGANGTAEVRVLKIAARRGQPMAGERRPEARRPSDRQQSADKCGPALR